MLDTPIKPQTQYLTKTPRQNTPHTKPMSHPGLTKLIKKTQNTKTRAWHLLYLFYFIYLNLLLCTPLFLFLRCTFFHCKSTIPVFYLQYCIYFATMAFFCLYLPYLTSFAHIVYRLVSTVLLTVCLVYSMCNSVSLYVSNCFALCWPGRNCKLELVLNLPTWLNKGEINTIK